MSNETLYSFLTNPDNVKPSIPFLPLKNGSGIAEAGQVPASALWMQSTNQNQYFPLSFGKESDKDNLWLLPYEPIIDISGRNNIIRRYVAKGKLIGSIKEHWSQDDYEITIRGALMGSILTGKVEDCYPIADFQRLVDYMTTGEPIKVLCEPLQLLGINYIAIEDFSFPFTKGENVQAYQIKAYSDHSYQLLIDVDDE